MLINVALHKHLQSYSYHRGHYWSWFFSFSLTGGRGEGRGKAVRIGEQDETVLRNAYHQMRGWNNNMQVDKRMEELAQSHGCVGRHEVHNNSWQDREILQTYNNVGAIIACAGSQVDITSIHENNSADENYWLEISGLPQQQEVQRKACRDLVRVPKQDAPFQGHHR